MRTTAALADYLEAQFPTWKIHQDTRVLDQVTRPTIVIYPEEFNRIDTIDGFALAVQLKVWLLTEKINSDRVEPELDDLLADLLKVLDANPAFTFERGSRGMLEGAGHGWQLDVTVIYQVVKD